MLLYRHQSKTCALYVHTRPLLGIRLRYAQTKRRLHD